MALSVSVVIPTLDRKSFLIEALESCLNQSYALSQIIVVDNGSRDGTKTLKFPDGVVFLEERSKGAGFARIKGLSKVVSSHVLFLDSDDLLTRTAIETLVNQAEESNALVTYGRIVNFQKVHGEVLLGKSVLSPITSSSLIDVRSLDIFGQFEGDNLSFPRWIIHLQESFASFAKTNELVCYRRVHESNLGRSEEARKFYFSQVGRRIESRKK